MNNVLFDFIYIITTYPKMQQDIVLNTLTLTSAASRSDPQQALGRLLDALVPLGKSVAGSNRQHVPQDALPASSLAALMPPPASVSSGPSTNELKTL